MNLLIPSIVLALVALLLLVALGKVLGGHSAAREPDPRSSDAIAPPKSAPALAPPSSSAPLPPPSAGGPAGLEPALRRELEGLIARGQVIPAIKRYREVFGVGLKEAKLAVDRLRSEGPAGPQPAPLQASSDASRDPGVLEALAQGRKIQAIKLYRELSGVGLREAKEAVEAIPLPPEPLATTRPDPLEDPELRAALASGKKILAIKRYRELTGAGLKESKEAVERIQG